MVDKSMWSRFGCIVVIRNLDDATNGLSFLAELDRVGIRADATVWRYRTPLVPILSRDLGFVYKGLHQYFSRAFSYYQALKIAYGKREEHTLVIEDTVRFLLDTSFLRDVLVDLPDDYDFAKFEWIPNHYGGNRSFYLSEIASRRSSLGGESSYWVRSNGLKTSGCAVTAYSRKGLERAIALMERSLVDRSMRSADGYTELEEFYSGLSCYLSVPIAAIQPMYVRQYLSDFTLSDIHTGYAVEKPETGLSSSDFISRKDLVIGELVKAVPCEHSVRVAVVSHTMPDSIRLFRANSRVGGVVLIEAGSRHAAGDDAITRIPLDRLLDRSTVPDVDLVYVERAIAENADMLSALRSAFPSTVSFAGSGYSSATTPLRTSVHSVFGLPDQWMNLQLWVVFGSRRTLKEKYWRFDTGRLGNRLYCLLQVHRMGTWNRYVTRDDETYYQFKRLGAETMVESGYGNGDESIFSWGTHWDIGTNYTEEDVLAFVRDTVLRSSLYNETIRNEGLDESTVALHIRCTDMLVKKRWNAFDRIRYITDACTHYRELFRDSGSGIRARVFSDSVDTARELYGSTLSRLFSSVEYMKPEDSVEDLVRIAIHRHKILFNSTYSAWAGYIGEAIFGERHVVVAPSLFLCRGGNPKSPVSMSTLALRSWSLLPVVRVDGSLYPENDMQP